MRTNTWAHSHDICRVNVGAFICDHCAGNIFYDVMCSAITTNTRDYAWQMQDKPIQAANINGLALNNNYLVMDNNCSNSQVNYTNPVYLVNVTNFSGTQPRVLTTKPIQSTHYIGTSPDEKPPIEDRDDSEHDHDRHNKHIGSTYQKVDIAFSYHQQPQASAPEAGFAPSVAIEPKGSVSFGGTD